MLLLLGTDPNMEIILCWTADCCVWPCCRYLWKKPSALLRPPVKVLWVAQSRDNTTIWVL